jgi:hypothetical protein
MKLFIGKQFGIGPIEKVVDPVYSSIDDQQVIDEISRRLADVERGMKWAVQGDKVLSQIAICPEAILISSDKIGVLGEATFADWIRDINGEATGVIDPSITQIRGGVIRTGRVVSKDSQSWLDLDAQGGAAFLKCRGSSRINADGTFEFGGVGGTKSLKWDGVDLTIGPNSLINGTTAAAVVSTGATALSTAQSASSMAATANNNANAALARPVGVAAGLDFQNEAIRIMQLSSTTIQMSNSSTLFRSSGGVGGVFIGGGGIFGRDTSGNETFSINGSSGEAMFRGNVFSKGYVFAEGNTLTGYSVVADGQNQSITAAMYGVNPSAAISGRWITGVMGRAVAASNAIGVVGETDRLNSNTIGLVGIGSLGIFADGNTAGIFQGQAVGIVASGNVGAKFSSLGGANGLALEITGRMSITSTSKVNNLNASFLDGSTKWDLVSLSNATGQSSFAFSTNNGDTWSNILLKKV